MNWFCVSTTSQAPYKDNKQPDCGWMDNELDEVQRRFIATMWKIELTTKEFYLL